MNKLGIFIAIIFFLIGCKAKKEGNEIRVTVLRGPSAIAFAYWMENPPRINGKTVILDIVDSPEQMQALLIKKESDIAVLPMINAANLYNKGINYRLAGCPVWGNIYLVGKPDAKYLHIFGAGTTPDILARHYIEKHQLPYELNYTLGTPSEISRGLLAGKVEAAVLAEPFVSMVLREDADQKILADLNNPKENSPGFAETAILIHADLTNERHIIDSLLKTSCLYAVEKPGEVIRILENKELFPKGLLTKEGIERCRIKYMTTVEARTEIEEFLSVIYKYEPKAIGNTIPDEDFYK